MPKIKIDGKEYLAADGETILQTAQRNGIYIPRYCYHPALSVAGNCRMCLVEIEKMPKLQIACSTLAAEGMSVLTQSEKVKKARKNVLEFLLINHPVDCPICDQAGECYLQDYYMDYGLHKSRIQIKEKIKREKRIQIGDYLILDRERCILCTRCVRFCEEITKTEELFVAQRGDRSYIDIKPNEKLNNPYSMNIADICPVGAFTSADFRFRKRVWFLKTVNSVCLGCATGCSIKVQYDDNTIYRILPNPNEETNTWICDSGRMTYKELYAEKRLRQSSINGKSVQGKNIVPIFEYLKSKDFSKAALILSPYLSLEDNLALYYFAHRTLKMENIFVPEIKEGKISDGILINTDKAPNSKGLELMKKAFSIKTLTDKEIEKFDFIITCLKQSRFLKEKKEGLYFSLEESDLKGALIAMKSYFETPGTFVNYKGKVSFASPSVSNLNKLSVWETIKELSSLFSSYLPFEEFEDLRKTAKNEILGKRI